MKKNFDWEIWERENEGIAEQCHSSGSWTVVWISEQERGYLKKDERASISASFSRMTGTLPYQKGIPQYIVNKANELMGFDNQAH